MNGGYKFKKGKRRSKRSLSYSGDDTPKPKQQKTTESIRKQHIANLKEDLRDRLQLKEKRRSQEEMLRNYKVCDQLMEDVTELKESELKLWMRNVQQSQWILSKEEE